MEASLATNDRNGPGPRAVLRQMWRFGVVGGIGFVVDSAVLMAAIALGAGPYGGRVLSYLAAATTTWALNRAWTFRGRGAGPAHRQWARFLLVNLVGFALNYGTYALLLSNMPLVAAHPVLGVAAGALAGMGGNFALSRRFVFTDR
ncbi:Hypothetical protein HVPorG_02224 [Roseomonas mucosa]|uniref:GtrA-like protein n=1 Tax=Roseomonas mucosa TaxID=207340 RepID=A0A1S8D9T1_9PROT|nr:Hypothetical protein RADP37_02224 [Roseomonas mucosa]GAV32643.1 GtrA-like protein [Roseomonas sp. TAS13]MDT8353788.1 GtrA family protein [Roseomonas mucosa]ONH84258.1 GtrA-like protein [Roseomonas mucosa]QDJ10168.1 Hypothetical protein HVPorG_02224 [Roseomonas mucosa]